MATVVAEFSAKTTNIEKTIYFLSLMSFSINGLKPHILFSCKNFMFSDYAWKKLSAPGNGGGRRVGAPSPPPPTPPPLRTFSTVLPYSYLTNYDLSYDFINTGIFVWQNFSETSLGYFILRLPPAKIKYVIWCFWNFCQLGHAAIYNCQKKFSIYILSSF